MYEKLLSHYEVYKKFIIDVPKYIDLAFKNNKKIVFEGAQGTLIRY